VRGEKLFSPIGVMGMSGSSPRAWGKGTTPINAHTNARIIPTCVGKSCSVRPEAQALADHPHVRGEKRHADAEFFDLDGSSPRAWGKARFPI